MEIDIVTKEEYDATVSNPFSRFESSNFIELNKHKVDEIFYFVFRNSKNRLALAGGIKDGTLKFPFSATYGIFSEITKDNRIECYIESLTSLKGWALEKGIKTIIFNTPALCYGVDHITKFQNALVNTGFKLIAYDLNYEFNLNKFTQDYLTTIDHCARKNFKTAQKNNLYFAKTDDVDLVYDIIKRNRESRGFPLRMTLDEVKKTSKIIPSDFFIVYDENNNGIASSLVHHLKSDLVRVVYWGNTVESELLRPINFLSYNLFNYYKSLNVIKTVDIGTSTVDSIPNEGLCAFKESIGCNCSPKMNYSIDF